MVADKALVLGHCGMLQLAAELAAARGCENPAGGSGQRHLKQLSLIPSLLHASLSTHRNRRPHLICGRCLGNLSKREGRARQAASRSRLSAGALPSTRAALPYKVKALRCTAAPWPGATTWCAASAAPDHLQAVQCSQGIPAHSPWAGGT